MKRLLRITIVVLTCLLLALAAAGCGGEEASDEPPPPAAQAAFDHVRAGYGSEDAAVFTQDFAEIMFTDRTAEDYLDVVSQLKTALGAWGDEATYLGAEDGAHSWRVRFEKGTPRVVIVLDEEEKVSGLWFH